MLKALTVQDLVVVRSVDVEFKHGLTVLSGETGAGKSILIEALGLALGRRADSKLVRAGSERATVTAVFDLSDASEVRTLLETHGVDADNECVLRRVLSKDGRSRSFCNSSPVSVQLLRQIGAGLVDVHAQHAGRQMLLREIQRRLLDEYGDLQAPVAEVNQACETWKAVRDELARLEAAGAERDRFELLLYQVSELSAARIDAAEIKTIEVDFKLLANAAANLEHCAAVGHALNGDGAGILSALQTASSRGGELAGVDSRSATLLDLLEQSTVTIEEAVHELDRLEGSIAIDPERLQRLDERLAELHKLARKHHIEIEELPKLFERLERDLAALENQSAAETELHERLHTARLAYIESAALLSERRATTASGMQKDITLRLRDLGIPHAEFTVSLQITSDAVPLPHGLDRIEFVLSTNPGQPPGPLNKIASGGELSRVGLAIQAATACHAGVPVVVYDEVDTGIGGTTANIVGRNLRDVASHCQVICITHSPQVASAGDQHLVVSKSVVGGHTETRIKALGEIEREAEIARMLGAAEATESSVAHARDLIAIATQHH